MTGDACRLRDEIKNLEATVEKCEEDKNTKDSQIRTLRDEIAHQEDMIVKLGKEKKSAGEGRQKTEEDKNSAETLNKNVQDMNASKLKRQFKSSEANKKLNNKKLAIEHAGMDKNRFASQMEALRRAPSASGKPRTLTEERVRE